MYLVIGRQNCTFCDQAKEKLEAKGTPYVYVDITSGDAIVDQVWKHFLVEDMKAKTVPQVFRLLGGFQELSQDLVYAPEHQ